MLWLTIILQLGRFDSHYNIRKVNEKYLLLKRLENLGIINSLPLSLPISTEEYMKYLKCLPILKKSPTYPLIVGVELTAKVLCSPSRSCFSCVEFRPHFGLWFTSKIYGYISGTAYYEQLEGVSPKYHWDPFFDPNHNLYTWDVDPIAGRVDFFDIRTDRGYLFFKLGWGELFIGRHYVRWGPSRYHSVILSGYARPMDYFYYIKTKRKKFFRLFSFHAMISDTIIGRRFSGQRVELYLFGDKITLGFSDGALYTGENDPLRYAHPLGLYYFIQRRLDNKANLFIAVDGKVKITKGVSVYFEFFGDDPVLFEIKGKPQPMQFSCMIGGEVDGKIWNREVGMCFEGVVTPRWTYTHQYSYNTYTIWDVPIGHWMGDDVIALYWEGSYYHSYTSGCRIFIEHLLHGEGRLFEHWEESGLPSRIKCPSGVVEKRIRIGIEGWRENFKGMEMKLNIGKEWIWNEGNKREKNSSFPFIILFLSWTHTWGKKL